MGKQHALLILAGFVASSGCGSQLPEETDDKPVLTFKTEDTAETDVPPVVLPDAYELTVTLDGQVIAGAVVMQGGGDESWLTGADGRATVTMDDSIPGERGVFASHPLARVGYLRAGEEAALTLELVGFDPSDNEAYVFDNPGSPTDNADTGKCAHCHTTLNEDWYDSAHRQSASNPAVQDLYAGTVSALSTQADCQVAGGQWWSGLEPGTGLSQARCYLGDGALPTLNDNCGDSDACDATATAFGACADCHAPGIDGVLGGRNLLEATGFAYEYGVHCDVCHKVESVDLTQPAGVGGRLHIVRPSEDPVSQLLGTWDPLTFGPYVDVANPRMGSVYRDHFAEPEFCAGCHELQQEVLVPGAAVDSLRWPDGKLPVHTTFSEWEAGPMNPAAPCASCHMPPDAEVGNSADLYNIINLTEGVTTGWPRASGAVRKHTWIGPRYVDSPMLELAASVDITKSVVGGELTASVTVKNVGPGHAIPTGEPLRSLVLLVRAECAAVPLDPTGGDAVPDIGGALDWQASSGDWSVWPGAQVGDVIRVVVRPGGFYDYVGYGPFGDGTFDATAKGMAVEEVVGESTVLSVAADVVTLDQPLPVGDVAYRVSPGAWPVDGAVASGWAGAPGFAFARVLADEDGRRMVPHFAATDVVSDNRLLPQESWTSTHRFTSPCPDPVVTAVLVHRAYPLDMAAQKGWTLTDSVMVEASR